MAKFGRNGVGPAKPEKPGALQRVEALEEFREELLRAVRQTFAVVEQRLQNLEETAEALVNKVGRDDVEEEVKRLHIERLEAKSEQEKAALDAAIKQGQIVETDAIGELSVVVGSEVDKDGNKLYPSRVQLLYATLKPEYKEKLLGAKVGEVVVTPFESKFTVLAIYNVVDPKDRKPLVAETDAPVPQAPLAPTTPLTEEEEAELVEQLAAVAEAVQADAEAVEEALVEELAGEAVKA
jgi:hypothetical protein